MHRQGDEFENDAEFRSLTEDAAYEYVIHQDVDAFFRRFAARGSNFRQGLVDYLVADLLQRCLFARKVVEVVAYRNASSPGQIG